VVTIHDATPFDYPNADARKRKSEQEFFLLSAKTACCVLTVSEYAAGRIVEQLGIERERIVVTPLAASSAFTPATLDGEALKIASLIGGRPYLFCVSSMHPVKNFETLYRAWKEEFSESELALVATGADPSRYPGITALPRNDDAGRLASLYRLALFVAVPSLSESFPLPVIEAMSCGAPVIANRVGGLPEVGGEAVHYIERSEDVTAWRRGLRRLYEDSSLRSRLREAGLARAKLFSWERTAQMTFEALHAAATSGL
jgi:glycosyltransferase involved in cell wall biosynthesis